MSGTELQDPYQAKAQYNATHPEEYNANRRDEQQQSLAQPHYEPPTQTAYTAPPADNGYTPQDGPQPDEAPTGGAARTLLAEQNPALLKIKNSLFIFWNIMEIATIATILGLYWGQECDRIGFTIFLVARIVLCPMLCIVYMANFQKKPEGSWKLFITVLNLVDYGFVLYALIELGETETCKHTSPALFGLTVALVTTTLTFFCSPILLLILVCCCLPCIVAVLVRVITAMDAPTAATEEQLSKLEQFEWTPTILAEKGAAGGTSECPICLAEYDAGEMLTILPCRHAFHFECTKQWQIINKTCALCRRDPFEGDSSRPASSSGAASLQPPSDVEAQ